MSDEEFCQLFRRARVSAGNQVPHFRQATNDHQDGVRPVRPGYPRHEVHGEILPGAFGDREGTKDTERCVPRGLRTFAGVTVSTEAVYFFSYAWLIVVPS